MNNNPFNNNPFGPYQQPNQFNNGQYGQQNQNPFNNGYNGPNNMGYQQQPQNPFNNGYNQNMPFGQQQYPNGFNNQANPYNQVQNPYNPNQGFYQQQNNFQYGYDKKSKFIISNENKSKIYCGSMMWLAIAISIICIFSAAIVGILGVTKSIYSENSIYGLGACLAVIGLAAFINVLCGISRKIRFRTSYAVASFILIVLLLSILLPFGFCLLTSLLNNQAIQMIDKKAPYSFTIATVISAIFLWISWIVMLAVKRNNKLTKANSIWIAFGLATLPATIICVLIYLFSKPQFDISFIIYSCVAQLLLFIYMAVYFDKLNRVSICTNPKSEQSDIKFWSFWLAQQILAWFLIVLLIILMVVCMALADANNKGDSKTRSVETRKRNRLWFYHVGTGYDWYEYNFDEYDGFTQYGQVRKNNKNDDEDDEY